MVKVKKNGANISLQQQFGPVGKRVGFDRDDLIERAKLAVSNNKLKGLNAVECIEYLNKLKDKTSI